MKPKERGKRITEKDKLGTLNTVQIYFKNCTVAQSKKNVHKKTVFSSRSRFGHDFVNRWVPGCRGALSMSYFETEFGQIGLKNLTFAREIVHFVISIQGFKYFRIFLVRLHCIEQCRRRKIRLGAFDIYEKKFRLSFTHALAAKIRPNLHSACHPIFKVIL